MSKLNVEKLAFNRGLISPLALSRIDIKRIGLAAEDQTNWMPRTLGPMSLRPGLEYKDSTLNNAAARHIPFVFSNTDTAIIELTDSVMRVRVGEVAVTRVAVSTAVTNGTFLTDLSGWASADVGTAVSSWATGGYLSLLGDGTNEAARKQTLTIVAADQNKEHALRIVVNRGSCLLRVGSADGLDDYISETTLTVGTHSLAFTPTGASAFIDIFSRGTYAALVDSCTIEAAGTMQVTTAYPAAALGIIAYEQSADVIFLAAYGYKQSRIERRGTTSWSFVDFVAEDGPFRSDNLTPTTITPSAIYGTITLTASKPLFATTNVGSLYKITSVGQTVVKAMGALNVYSDPIQVTGLTATRGFTIDITGTWTATVTLQRSVGVVGAWVNVTSYTANQTALAYNDGFDNQIIFYRLATTAWTSGTATGTLTYAFGSITGVAKAVAYTSSTVLTAVVTRNLGAITPTASWAEGSWSDRRGYPSTVVLHDGRLWWAGKDKIVASVSDNYSSYDPNYVGDAGPINRSIGQGPVDNIGWLMSSYKLLVGAQSSERVIRSTGFDEPITPTNYNMKPISTYGSASLMAAHIDNEVFFVDRTAARVMDITVDLTGYGITKTNDLTVVVPEIGTPSIVRLAVQRRPDTRLHCVRSDGKVAVLIFDAAEDVKCWVLVETAGVVEDAIVLPGATGSLEDTVYYVVNRVINGHTVRFLEKWALISECVGGTVNKQADAFYYWTGAATTVISGLSHLLYTPVVCWADGVDQGTFTVDGTGSITLPVAVTSAVIGLSYMASYTSTKLAYGAQAGSALNQKKKVDHIGVVLQDTHYQGLKYGSDANYLDDLPQVEAEATTAANTVWANYDDQMFNFNGTWDTDSRVYLQAAAPRPCTVLSIVLGMTTNG